MPSRPSLQACANTVGPSCSICSFSRRPEAARAITLASVAFRTSSGSRRRSSRAGREVDGGASVELSAYFPVLIVELNAELGIHGQAMKRRKFITMLGGTAAAWPLAVRAQPAKIPRIGFMGNSTAELEANLVRPFSERLRELGY